MRVGRYVSDSHSSRKSCKNELSKFIGDDEFYHSETRTTKNERPLLDVFIATFELLTENFTTMNDIQHFSAQEQESVFPTQRFLLKFQYTISSFINKQLSICRCLLMNEEIVLTVKFLCCWLKSREQGPQLLPSRRQGNCLLLALSAGREELLIIQTVISSFRGNDNFIIQRRTTKNVQKINARSDENEERALLDVLLTTFEFHE